MESHCSQNESPPQARVWGSWCACALKWKHPPGCPVAVFCGIVSHPCPLVFLFTRCRLEFCLTSDNGACCSHVSWKQSPKNPLHIMSSPPDPSSLTPSMTCGNNSSSDLAWMLTQHTSPPVSSWEMYCGMLTPLWTPGLTSALSAFTPRSYPGPGLCS